MKKLILAAGLFGLHWLSADACTSYLVTKGASKDGSTMISYAADSHIRYGELYFRVAGKHAPGTMITCYDRGTNKPLAQIPQAPETYRVVGMTNEFGVSIGESTFGGISRLKDTTGGVDYGSLMFYTLQRVKTAREAIKFMVELVDTYGYYSSGESFSISDPNEVWIMEMIGKGTKMSQSKRVGEESVNLRRGAIWVALLVPDGYISAHANQARIRQFPLEKRGVKHSISSKNLNKIFDTEVTCVYAHDVISIAREEGLYSGKDEDFSFSDIYDPLDFAQVRACDARVWAMFNRLADGMEQYWDYAQGLNLKNRMPLWIKPNRKVTPQDLMACYRDHFQGTELDMSKDIGAGPYHVPYRWRPMRWNYNGKTYFHERTTATQQTAFTWIAQSRPNFPSPELGTITWFSVDDNGSSVFVPFYAAMLKAPDSYAEGNGDIITYSPTSAFWAFNKVANYAYSRYSDMFPDIQKQQIEWETAFANAIPVLDEHYRGLWEHSPQAVREQLTEIGCKWGDEVVESWNRLFEFLLVKYMDGNIKHEENGQFIRTQHGWLKPPMHPEMPDFWKKMIIDNTGDRFLIPTEQK
jgi:dipeptidase